jgi:hypothetical protein
MIKQIKDLEIRTRSLAGAAGKPARVRSSTMIAALLMLALAGCAARAQGEAVYLKQHRASIALTQAVLAAEYENPALVDTLYDSETALNKACAPLQEASYRRMSGDSVNPLLKLQAYNALDTCAATARNVEDLLWRIDPITAGHYLDRPFVSVKAEQ